jgi:hypothetical protein
VGGFLLWCTVHVNIGMVGTTASFTLAVMRGATSSPSLGGIILYAYLGFITRTISIETHLYKPNLTHMCLYSATLSFPLVLSRTNIAFFHHNRDRNSTSNQRLHVHLRIVAVLPPLGISLQSFDQQLCEWLCWPPIFEQLKI